MKAFSLRLGMMLALLTVPLARGSDGSGDYALPPPAEHFLHADAVDWKAVVPPPPEKGSVPALADLETVLQVQASRTAADVAWVKKTEKDNVYADFGEAIGPWFEPKTVPGLANFIRQVTADVQVVNRKVKDLYPRTRPFKLEPTVQPCVTLPTSNSYPSGHTLRSFVWAGLLSDVFPDHQAQLYQLAHRIAWGRVQGGAHFPSDTVAARIVAQKVIEELRKSPAYRAAVEQCRTEVAPFLLKKAA
jgi:acid phosphatase (class A)